MARPRMTDHQAARMADARQSGESIADIAERFGRAESTVKDQIRRYRRRRGLLQPIRISFGMRIGYEAAGAA
jgi:transposase